MFNLSETELKEISKLVHLGYPIKQIWNKLRLYNITTYSNFRKYLIKQNIVRPKKQFNYKDELSKIPKYFYQFDYTNLSYRGVKTQSQKVVYLGFSKYTIKILAIQLWKLDKKRAKQLGNKLYVKVGLPIFIIHIGKSTKEDYYNILDKAFKLLNPNYPIYTDRQFKRFLMDNFNIHVFRLHKQQTEILHTWKNLLYTNIDLKPKLMKLAKQGKVKEVVKLIKLAIGLKYGKSSLIISLV